MSEIARTARAPSQTHGVPSAPDRAAMELELLAQLQLQHLRGLKLASLRWLALSSLPAWLEVHWSFAPDLVGWLAFLAQGSCLALAVAYSGLEYRWARRAAQLEPGSPEMVVHASWTDWDELRSALWHGLALVSLVPWLYVGFHRPLPASLLSALTASAWTVLLLLAAAETVAPLRLPSGRAGAALTPHR